MMASAVYRRDIKETVVSVICNESRRDELTEEQLQWRKGSICTLHRT